DERTEIFLLELRGEFLRGHQVGFITDSHAVDRGLVQGHGLYGYISEFSRKPILEVFRTLLARKRTYLDGIHRSARRARRTTGIHWNTSAVTFLNNAQLDRHHAGSNHVDFLSCCE